MTPSNLTEHSGRGVKLLTLTDVAARLTVSRRTVERLVAQGRIRVIRVSPGRVAVEEREVDAYLAAVRRAA